MWQKNESRVFIVSSFTVTYQQFYDIKIFSYTHKIDNENIEICEQVIEMSDDDPKT